MQATREGENVFLHWAQQQVAVSVVARQVRSGSRNSVFQLQAEKAAWFLKTGPDLAPERDRLRWLQKRVAVPQVVGFTHVNGQDALLLTAVEGRDLAYWCDTWTPETIIARLAAVLHQLHGVDVADCPFGSDVLDAVLVHGDACLPNFLFNAAGGFCGYVDMGDAGRGSARVDLAAAVWSLQYNLGPGYGVAFLRAYGMADADEILAETLRREYDAF